MNIEIRSIDWQQTIPIRHEVLWPDKEPEFCHVKNDKEAWHFGVYIENKIENKLVCVASIYPQGEQARLRKFATLHHYQNKGIGSKMLTFILKTIKERGINYFWCDARETALNFYQPFGLKPEGVKFYKSDVAYYKMSMNL